MHFTIKYDGKQSKIIETDQPLNRNIPLDVKTVPKDHAFPTFQAAHNHLAAWAWVQLKEWERAYERIKADSAHEY